MASDLEERVFCQFFLESEFIPCMFVRVCVHMDA